jgi:metal-responsive CopG/Arc/MetJ family transcriptional regulator
MRIVQMTLDDELVETVDKVAKKLKTTRSAFTRDALRSALGRLRERELERKHRAGYRRHPVNADEFSVWEKEQDWGDE